MTRNTMDHTHITTIKNPDQNRTLVEDSKTFIKRNSFSVETETTLGKLSDTEFYNVSKIAGNSQGGTFAQRARAAELQAARALRESKISVENTTQSSLPAQRGIVTLKMPRRQKWTPLDLTDSGGTVPEAVIATKSPSEQPLTPILKNEPSYEAGDHLAEKQTIKNRNHESATLLQPFPLPILQSHDLSEYPAELGARISGDFNRRPDLQMFPTMENLHPSSSQDRATNFQNSESVSGQQQYQNAYFNDANTQARVNEQLEFADPFAYVPGATGGEHHFYHDRYHQQHYAQPVDRVANVGMNPMFNKNYPAVKGTPTTADNAARFQSSNPPNIQNFQGQNYNSMPSQRLDHVGRSSQPGNYLMTSPPPPGIVDMGTQPSHQFYQGNPSYYSQQARSAPPQGLSINQPIHSVFNVPKNDYSARSRSGHQSSFHPEPKHQDYMDELQSIIATNPFERKNLSRAEERAKMEEDVNKWWTRDNRVPLDERRRLDELIANESRARAQKSNIFSAFGNNGNATNAANKTDASGTEPELKDPSTSYSNEELVNELLVPAISNLMSYKTEPKDKVLNPFGPPPSWAIDHTPGGNESFFSQQWGQPPQRVGRDPRYRAMQHDGRSSVFEDPTGRFPREEFTHERSRGTGRRPPF